MIERILHFSIQYRYLIVFLTIAASFYGMHMLQKLPIDAVPDVTNNQVQINTIREGLSPEQVEKQITFVVENALKGIPGLESTRSISRSGFSQVTAIFEDGVDIYFARQQISEKLNEAIESLPEGADPIMGPISTGLSEVYFWAVEFDGKEGAVYVTPEGWTLRSEEDKLAYLRTVQDWIIKPQLIGLPGLADVDSIGGYVMQVQVTPDIDALSNLKLSLNDLVTAIEHSHKAIGVGYVEVKGEALLVTSDATIRNPEEILGLVVTTRQGKPIYIRDVADVQIGLSPRYGSSSTNGHEAVIGTAMMRIGENSRTVADEVNEKINDVKQSLPPHVEIVKLMNRSKLVNSTIHTVITNLAEGALLVVAVLFFMLGNIPAALITALVIPLSMVLTSIGMVKSHISGNLMSLGALDFGLIVDGAIIIAENCLRKLSEERKKLGRALSQQERLDVTQHATSEMIKPSVFGQIIIMVVYFPIFTLSGVEGKIFHPMAATVIFALAAAFILSITFVPAMIAFFVKGPEKESALEEFHRPKAIYEPILHYVMKKPVVVIGTSALLVLSSFYIFFHLGQEFTPTLDEQDLAIQATRGPSTSLASATKMQVDVEKTLLGFPEVERVFSKTGTAELASDPMPLDASDTFVILKPRKEWPNPSLAKDDLIESMEEELHKHPGNIFEFTQPIQMRFNELIGGVKSDVAVKIYGDDLAVLQKQAEKIAKVVKQIPGASDVTLETPSGTPHLNLKLDRNALSRLGVQPEDVLNELSIAFSGGQAGWLYQGDRRYEIVVRLSDVAKNNLDSLHYLPLVLPNIGKTIPLKEVVNISSEETIGQVSREDSKRMVSVQANVRGIDLQSFIEKTKEAIYSKVKLPAGYWIDFGGQFEQLLSAKERLKLVLPICLLMIFALLFTSLGSFTNALLVFTGIPLAVTGGIYALFILQMPFSISAAVGFIALFGIAVLNGLVLVSTIQGKLNSGENLYEAITHSCLTRLRPVLMTALVASLGFLPMALATGAGAEVQKPIAVVVIGGLISSTLLTLLILPALFWITYKEKAKIKLCEKAS